MRRRSFWLITRIVTFLVVSVGVVLAILFVSRVRATSQFFDKYPPPGEILDVGGFSMHLHCTGTGEPTVVLEAGYVDFSPGWSKVQPLIAETNRVCSYDRAGLLWSEPSPHPRTVDAVGDELARLLRVARVEEPYVLVGHSMGGLVGHLDPTEAPS